MENENEKSYLPLVALAGTLNLPRTFLRELADQKKIPCLNVRGRLRFNPAAVKAALDKLAERGRL